LTEKYLNYFEERARVGKYFLEKKRDMRGRGKEKKGAAQKLDTYYCNIRSALAAVGCVGSVVIPRVRAWGLKRSKK